MNFPSRCRTAACLLYCLLIPGILGAAENASISTGVTLEEFFDAALEFSPRLRIAEENRNIGTARKDAAKGQLLPQVSANGSLSRNRRGSLNTLQEFDGERYSLRLVQVLFNWQAFAAKRQANFVEDQLEAEYFYELAAVLTDVAQRYFNVLQAQDALESLASELEAVSTQLEQIRSMYDLQLAQITDLRQAQAALAAVQADQIYLQSELDLAREALRSRTGINVGELFTLDDEVELPVVENGVGYWVQLALENNMQVRAKEFAREAAAEGISQRRGAYMPQVSLIAQRQDSNVGFDNAPIQQSDTTYLGVDVSIPLYAGGTRNAAMREARSVHAIASSELQQAELETSAIVRMAFMRLQASATFLEAAQVLVDSTVLSAEAMQQGFNLGTVTSVDVLNALRDQFQAQRDLQRARYEHVNYYLLLKQETGTLSAEDMREVGSWLRPAVR